MIFDKILKTQDQVLKLVNRNLEDKSSILLTYMNQHCYNIYSSNNMYRELIGSHFNVYLDGIGIYFTLKLLKFKNVERFNGTDLIDKIFQLYSEKKTKLYLLGGAFSPKFVNKKCYEKKITLSGYHTGFFKEEDLPSLVQVIINSGAEALVIGMGVPQQEIIAKKISEITSIQIIHCVGGYFEFYFGAKKRIPKLFRTSGFEWLTRLVQEPKRLWKRYLVGIPVFVFRIIRMKFKK